MGQEPFARRFSGFEVASVEGEGKQAGEDANDVAVYRRLGAEEGDGGDGAGGIVAHAGEVEKLPAR